MRLEIGDYVIRSFAAEDVSPLVKYANDRRVSIQLRDRFPYPYTEADARLWIDYASGHSPETSFALASAEELIGGIGIELQDDVHRHTAEVGYWLGWPHWGKGIATRALRAMTDYAFATFPLVRIWAGVFESNPASARVLEKAGYEFEGRLRRNVFKDGRVMDQLIYSAVREADAAG